MFLYRTTKSNNKNNIFTSIIRECYIEVLGREPDTSGLNTYTRQLKRGWTKYDIKIDLYNSPEGRIKLMKKNHYQVPVESEIEREVEPEPEPEITDEKLFYESIETDKLSDLEFFNQLEKNIVNNWNIYSKDNNVKIHHEIKENTSYKITKGFTQKYASDSIKLLYTIKRSTYNNFHIENIDKDNVKIYVISRSKKLYLKINNENLNGKKLLQENFVNNKTVATIFKKQYYEDSDNFYLLVKSGIYINEKQLDSDQVNKYFVVDNKFNICKLINNIEFYKDNSNTLKFWI